MNEADSPSAAVVATQVTARPRTTYPAPFAPLLEGRVKRALGDRFGLTRFGVNLTTLAPGARSALRHAHALQDEFIYVLEGSPTLVTDAGPHPLEPGMCAGFKAGTGDAHHLVNATGETVVYLEVGDRTPDDVVGYPDDDLVAVHDALGWRFAHKDGTPY